MEETNLMENNQEPKVVELEVEVVELGKHEQVVEVPKSAELKRDPMSFVPLIVALITLINTFAVTTLGWEPLPYTSEQVNIGVSIAVQVVVTVWAWFRNNNVTKHGLKREAVANQAVPKK